MSSEKIPITNEKQYVYEGYFDIKETYSYIKHFLEHSKHYDVTEKDYDEKNLGGEKSILSLTEAEQEFTDYYKIIIKYEMNLKGKDEEVKVNGKSRMLTKGKAKIIINSYVEPDFQHKKPKGPMGKFLNKIYDKYIGTDELQKAIVSSVKDVNELRQRFKQVVNATLKN